LILQHYFEISYYYACQSIQFCENKEAIQTMREDISNLMNLTLFIKNFGLAIKSIDKIRMFLDITTYYATSPYNDHMNLPKIIKQIKSLKDFHGIFKNQAFIENLIKILDQNGQKANWSKLNQLKLLIYYNLMEKVPRYISEIASIICHAKEFLNLSKIIRAIVRQSFLINEHDDSTIFWNEIPENRNESGSF